MTVTLDDMKDQVLERLSIENSNFIEDPEFISMFNSSLAELYEFMVENKSEDYFVTESNFTVSDLSGLASLPVDFFKLIAIDVQHGTAAGAAWVPLTRFTVAQRDMFQYGSSSGNSGRVRYKLHNSSIKLIPANSSNGTYRLWYIPRFVNKTALTDSIEPLELQNWHEYAIVDVCIKVQTKQDTDATPFMQQKAALAERIVKHSANRDAGEPFRLTGAASDDYDAEHLRRW